MDWLVDVSARASANYKALDEGLRSEVREHAALVAESPAEVLTRSWEFPGCCEHRFPSRVVEGMTVVLVFSNLDFATRRTTLVTILHVSAHTEEE